MDNQRPADNANPTILDASDLPSRRHESTFKKRDDGGTGLFSDLVPTYNYLNDPFEGPLSSSDSEDDVIENIDEQEIYGKTRIVFLCTMPSLPTMRLTGLYRPHLDYL